MRPVVDHADDSKEEGRHHAVGEHLEPGTRQPIPVEGGEAEHDKAHVRHGGKADNVLEVGLHGGDQSPVDHVDGSQDEDQRRPETRTFRQQHDPHPQRGEGTQLHQDPCVEHGHRRRRRDMAVGGPVMEGENAPEDSEAKKHEGEPEPLKCG